MVFVPHRFAGPFRRGRLLARPNRFLAVVELDDGERVEAHLGDRGRLEKIVVPGAEVHLSRAPEGGTRKTAYTLVCVRCPPAPKKRRGPLICLDPAGSNRIARALLEAGLVPPLEKGVELRAEVTVGRSRYDFAAQLERRWLIEVKNVGVAEDGAALFPDAPSVRASKHASELAALARAGDRAMLLFIAQRPEVREVRPHPVDPEFARQLAIARAAGVLLAGAAFEVDLRGFHFAGLRPVVLPADR